MALQRRFQTTIDPTQQDPAYQPGAVKPGLVRRGGVTGTGMRVPTPDVQTPIMEAAPAPSPTPESGPYTPPQPAYNTDGYQVPGYIPENFGAVPAGYEPSKWNDRMHQSPKYAVTRILNQFPQTPEGLMQALPDLQRAYPGTKLISRDKVDVPGVGKFDVGREFSAGGNKGWQWLPLEGESVTPYTPSPVSTPEMPTERNAILDILEDRRPLRTARYRGIPQTEYQGQER